MAKPEAAALAVAAKEAAATAEVFGAEKGPGAEAVVVPVETFVTPCWLFQS